MLKNLASFDMSHPKDLEALQRLNLIYKFTNLAGTIVLRGILGGYLGALILRHARAEVPLIERWPSLQHVEVCCVVGGTAWPAQSP